MMMTPQYLNYLKILHTRDHVMVILGVMALGVVAGWILSRELPDQWRRRIRRVYLVTCLMMFVMLVILLTVLPIN